METKVLCSEKLNELQALPANKARKELRLYCEELYGISPGMGNVQHCVDFIYKQADLLENTSIKDIVSTAPPVIETNRVTLDEQPAKQEVGKEIEEKSIEDSTIVPETPKPVVSKPIDAPLVKIDYQAFRPTMQLSGRGLASYISIPYWIHDWVINTVGWSDRIGEVDKTWHSTLKTMLYYINIHGYVNVRESRNSVVYHIKL